jgi:predicted dehydrogenase
MKVEAWELSISTVKFGLVGIGNIGGGHLKYLSEMANVEIVGVCDVDQEKSDKYARTYGTKAYYNATDLLSQSGLDVVIIAVPHYDHPVIAIEAFERGIHVMCEKPITVHVNDANRMIAAYEAAKLTYPN